MSKTATKPCLTVLKGSVLTALLITTGSLQAATISFSDTWSTTRTVNTGANTDNKRDSLFDSDTFSVSRFDSVLGTLNSVQLLFSEFRISSRASANFRDDDWANETKGRQELEDLRLTSSLAGYNFSRSRSDRVATCSDTGGLTSGASCSTNLGLSTTNFSNFTYNLTSASQLLGFIGAGSLSGSAAQQADLWTNETDGDDGYVNTRFGNVYASGKITVTYNYTELSPVPVPAAAWLFGSALIGLAGIGRSRKSN